MTTNFSYEIFQLGYKDLGTCSPSQAPEIHLSSYITVIIALWENPLNGLIAVDMYIGRVHRTIEQGYCDLKGLPVYYLCTK